VGQTVPLEAFEGCPLLVANADGRVGLCNTAATILLKNGSSIPLGRPCWEVTGFVTADGTPFCSEFCPVQRQARAGKVVRRQRVVLPSSERGPLDLDLLTFVLPPNRYPRRAVLHLILPGSPEVATAADNGPNEDARIAHRFDHLTRREREILRMLSMGLGTEHIAADLCISPTTVRNHVQHVLGKLEVHGRLEAIMALRRLEG
jgi:DNA-binding CsgD family transcriptional regulator